VGVSTQKNGLGVLCLISTYFIIWTLWRRRQGRNVAASKYQTYADYFVLLLTLLLLKGPPGKYSSTSGYSSTSIAALGIGLIIFFGLSWLRKRGKTMSPITATGMVVAFIAYGTALPLAGGLLGGLTAAFGRDSTFTGRTDIWSELVPFVQASPILGCGFGGFWTPEKRAIYIIGQAHNGYLEVLMEMGWVGLGLVAMFFIGCARKALRALPHDFDLASIALGMVLIASLHNATEATINSFTNFLTAVVLFFSACIGASPIRETTQTEEKPASAPEGVGVSSAALPIS
jgi:exopolysaccharide production protein ExoQ